jgi:predicted N-acetyltransferase YhbS
MTLRAVTIEASDVALHEAFLRFIPRVFPIDFRSWYAIGGWTDAYTVFALLDGDEVVASAASSRMECVVHGRTVFGHQLGAVGVSPEHRGRGLGRMVMESLLARLASDDLTFLFANESVLDFYPRFGFRRVQEHLFGAEVDIVPSRHRLHPLAADQLAHHALIAEVGRIAEPVTEYFGARDYGHSAAWYLSNFYSDCFYYTPGDDAVIVAKQAGDVLHVIDVIAPEQVDLDALLPHIVSAPVRRLELGFTPDRYVTHARVVGDAGADSPLFVRGAFSPGDLPFKYPLLAQT